MDISAISNSPKFSWRQKVSDGSDFVWISSTPSTSTSPARSGATRSFVPQMMLSSSFFVMRLPCTDERRLGGRALERVFELSDGRVDPADVRAEAGPGHLTGHRMLLVHGRG